MEDMIEYFWSDGDFSIMLCKFLSYIMVLFFLAVIIGSLRRWRL
jgi:hypothetical protein